jgi:hypothetical protein
MLIQAVRNIDNCTCLLWVFWASRSCRRNHCALSSDSLQKTFLKGPSHEIDWMFFTSISSSRRKYGSRQVYNFSDAPPSEINIFIFIAVNGISKTPAES